VADWQWKSGVERVSGKVSSNANLTERMLPSHSKRRLKDSLELMRSFKTIHTTPDNTLCLRDGLVKGGPHGM
jgi:hypothetical protein